MNSHKIRDYVALRTNGKRCFSKEIDRSPVWRLAMARQRNYAYKAAIIMDGLTGLRKTIRPRVALVDLRVLLV